MSMRTGAATMVAGWPVSIDGSSCRLTLRARWPRRPSRLRASISTLTCGRMRSSTGPAVSACQSSCSRGRASNTIWVSRANTRS
ncbi:hypothetical protein BSY18_4159 (plasmid) [Blastomonas sp. RAC04]|nr:hypothetical protein BSY18_4159 [Blastomonas sp. RAC04]